MTDMQFRILEILFESNEENKNDHRNYLTEKIESFKEISISYKKIYENFETKDNFTYDWIIQKHILGKCSLNKENDEIEKDLLNLILCKFIEQENHNGFLYENFRYSDIKLTENGKEVYFNEKNDKEKVKLREEKLFNAQLDNINSTLDTNKSVRFTNKELIDNTKKQTCLSSLTIYFIGISGLISLGDISISYLQYQNTTKVSVQELDSLNNYIQNLEPSKIGYIKDSLQTHPKFNKKNNK